MSRESNGASNGSTISLSEAGVFAAVSKIAAIAVQLGFLVLLVKSFALLD
jgi:hypothetical protein